MNVEYRMAFYHKNERIYSYPLYSRVEDAQLAILEMLAHQRGCALEDINIYVEECAPKERDFSLDCTAERIEEHDGEERWRILNVTNGKMYTHTGSLNSFIAKYEAGEA